MPARSPVSAGSGRQLYSPPASVGFIVSSQGQQQDGLFSLMLRVLEYHTQIVTGATSPTARQRTTQFMCPQ